MMGLTVKMTHHQSLKRSLTAKKENSALLAGTCLSAYWLHFWHGCICKTLCKYVRAPRRRTWVCVGVINICKNLTVKIPLSTKSNCSDCTALTHQTERPSPLLLSQTGSQIIEICRFNPQYSLKDSRPKKCSFCSFSLKNLYGFM